MRRVNYFQFPSWDEDYKWVCTQPCTCIQIHINFLFLNCSTFNMSTLCGRACVFSPDLLFAILWTVAPLGAVANCSPMDRLLCPQDIPGKITGDGLPFPSPGDLPDPGIEVVSLESPALAGGFLTNCLL